MDEILDNVAREIRHRIQVGKEHHGAIALEEPESEFQTKRFVERHHQFPQREQIVRVLFHELNLFEASTFASHIRDGNRFGSRTVTVSVDLRTVAKLHVAARFQHHWEKHFGKKGTGAAAVETRVCSRRNASRIPHKRVAFGHNLSDCGLLSFVAYQTRDGSNVDPAASRVGKRIFGVRVFPRLPHVLSHVVSFSVGRNDRILKNPTQMVQSIHFGMENLRFSLAGMIEAGAHNSGKEVDSDSNGLFLRPLAKHHALRQHPIHTTFIAAGIGSVGNVGKIVIGQYELHGGDVKRRMENGPMRFDCEFFARSFAWSVVVTSSTLFELARRCLDCHNTNCKHTASLLLYLVSTVF